MVTELHDRIAKYITKNALITDWSSIREYYARYSYLTFMCLIAVHINPDCKPEDLKHILCDNFLEDNELVEYILMTKDTVTFTDDIIQFINKQDIEDINEIYQRFLARDFILKDTSISFVKSKNNRDILGSYYTQENFAYEITQKTIIKKILMYL